MNNSKALFHDFINKITLHESADEIKSMAALVFEHVFGITYADIMSAKQVLLKEETQLDEIARRINTNEPIQYILGEAYFYNRKFMVNSSVLIPRPETEELISLVLSKVKHAENLRIADVGTGSGCIPITLALELKNAVVYAVDISEGALQVAEQNAKNLQTEVQFIKLDILKDEIPLSNLDVIVSNPPYITDQEKNNMHNNVLLYEPHLALFVPNENPLLFYKTIIAKAKRVLKNEGILVVEINALFGNEVKQLFELSGYSNVQIHKDINNKDRFVSGNNFQ